MKVSLAIFITNFKAKNITRHKERICVCTQLQSFKIHEINLIELKGEMEKCIII